MIRTRRHVYLGERIPPFWYGLAYHEFEYHRSVWFPIPVNYIVRVCVRIKYEWDKFRSKPTWIDKQVQAQVERELEQLKHKN